MLSKAARRLYERLLDLGPVQWEDGKVAGPEDPRVRELVDVGLVDQGPDYVTAVPPRVAAAQVTKFVSGRCRDMLDEMLAIEDFVLGCQQVRPSAVQEVEVLQSPGEVSLLSGAIVRNAEREVTSVNTLDTGPTGKQHFMGPAALSGVRFRIVYSSDYLGEMAMRRSIEQAVEGGEEARIHPSPPLKFKIADANAVLVPLDKTGAGGALLIRAPALCALFVDYFEKLWAESTPFDSSRTTQPTLLNPLQTRILGLIADDTPDLAIARQLDLSERTIRRHVGIVMDKLGARTRAGAVVMALERGLLAR